MTDDNIIGIDGRQAVQLRKDQAEREKREENTQTEIEVLRI
jgi:C-terminal processing protease CtpA/Prc